MASVFPPAASTLGTSVSIPSFSSGALHVGEADPTRVADVEQALAQQNPPAYRQFAGVLLSLARMPDEETRFAAAIAVAPNMNINMGEVRAAYEARVRMVDTLREGFKAQSKAELEKRVGTAQREVADIDAETSKITAEIARLTRRQEELGSLRTSKTTSIATERENIATVEQGMLMAFDVVKAKVINERDTVSRHTSGA
jgi:hypothetical protein